MLDIPNSIKDLFVTDCVRKNFRVEFLSIEHPDITNENIVDGSVVFDESLCQRNSLKFGLCEASTIQFETVGIGNIKNATIKCGIDVDVSSLAEIPEGAIQRDDLNYPSYYIPYGIFIVDSCLKQADMERRSVIAYSYENITDFNLPKSIQALKSYTWNAAESIVLSGQNILDLLFPSYAYRRKVMTKALSDEGRFTNYFQFNVGNTKHEARLVYSSFNLVENYNDKSITTYRTHYNPNAYSEALTRANEYIHSLGYEGDIHWDSPWINELGSKGEPCSYAFVGPYAIYKYNSDNLISIEAGLEQQCTDIEFVYDNQPHCIFVMKKDIGDCRTGIKFYKNDKYIAGYDWTGCDKGAVGVPSYIEVDDVRFEIGNYIEYNRELLGTNGIISLKSTPIRKTVYTLSLTTYKLTSKTRTEYSFAESLNKLMQQGMREIVESYIELLGKIGHFNRYGVFELKQISQNDGLYPSNTLFPNFDVFPKEPTNIVHRSMYSSAWYDDETILPIRSVSCTYKNLNNEEAFTEYLIPIAEKAQPIVSIDKTVYLEPGETYYEWRQYSDMPESTIGKQGQRELVVITSYPITSLSITLYYSSEYYSYEFPEGITRFVLNDANAKDLFDKLLATESEYIRWIRFTIKEPPEQSAKTKVDIEIFEPEYIPMYSDEPYATYDVSGNYFIKNGKFKEEDILDTIRTIGKAIGGLQYMPSRIECFGMPYIEAGDWVTVITEKGGFNTIILNRTTSGIQTLVDSFESKGE